MSAKKEEKTIVKEAEIEEALEGGKSEGGTVFSEKAEGKAKTITELPGIGPQSAEKLLQAGYRTLESIAVASPMELVEAAGLGEITAAKAINAARESLEMGYETADKIQQRRETIGRLSTGSKEVDALLGGGIETQSITEVYGQYASGKTQWAFQLSVMSQLPKEQGGLDGNVLYIDSENSFRPERIVQIANAKGLDAQKALKNIFVARAYNADHQMLLAEKAHELVKEKNIKLVIIDSLTAQFRAEFTGRGHLADRQQRLNRHMHTLQKLAEMNNVVLLVTNQVMSRPDIMFGDPTTPIGGHIVGHACLDGETLIQTADGSLKELKDVQQPILSADFDELAFQESAFSAKSSRDDIPKAFEIDTGHHITASPNHRFFKLEGFNVVEVKAKDIRKGEYLLHAKSMTPKTAPQPLRQPFVEEVVIFNEKGAGMVSDFLKESGFSRKEFPQEMVGVTPRQLRRVLNQSYPTAKANVMRMVRNGADAQLLENVETVETNKHRTLQFPTVFSADVSQICGYLLGDGHVEERSIRFKDARREVLEAYSTLFEKTFGIQGSISKVSKKNCFELSINSKAIADLFRELKSTAIDVAARSPKEVVAGFVRGFADAEGSVDKKIRKVSIAQKDEKVLQKIQLLLERFGIGSRLRIAGRKKFPTLEMFSTDAVKFGTSIGLTATDKQAKLDKSMQTFDPNKAKEIIPISRNAIKEVLKREFGFSSKVLRPRSYRFVTLAELERVRKALEEKNSLSPESRKAKQFIEKLLDNQVRAEKVRSVKVVANAKPLYDISVPGFENYVANGFIVHNSKTRIYLRKAKENKRVAKLVDSPSLPDGEALYSLTENGIEDM